MYLALALLLLVVVQLPAFAQEATPSVEPTDAPSPAPTVDPAHIEEATRPFWSHMNDLLITIENAVFSIWPSTPAFLKISGMCQGLQDQFPLAPWWMLAEIIPVLVVVFMIRAVKAYYRMIFEILKFILDITKIVALARLIAGGL